MKNKTYCLFIITIMFFLANAQHVHCYQISKTSTGAWIKWSSDSALYYVNITDAPDGFLASSLNAMDTWSAAGSKFSFEYGGLTSSDFDSGIDGYNTISYGFLDPSQYKDTLGLNRKWFYVNSGEIIEADIILNRHFTWGDSSGHDVESIILHELGHSLSLDDLYDPSFSNRVMYGYGSQGEIKRTLHQGDINGIVALYGSAPSTKYSVSVSANPSAGGSVSGGGAYNSGASVTVSATANTGYAFINWTEGGIEVSTSSSYTFIINKNRTLVANFEPDDTPIDPTSNFDEINATIESLNFFEGGRHGVPYGEREYNSYFEQHSTRFIYYELGLSYDTPGKRINFILEVVYSNRNGSVIERFNQEHYVDSNWTSSYHCSGWGWPNPGFWPEGQYTVEIYNSVNGKFITSGIFAVYADPLQYTISVSANPSAGGSVSGGGSFNQGDSVTVTATANTGYVFLNWTESGIVVSNQESYTFTVSSDRILTANFEISQYTLKYTAGENGSITGDTSQTVKHGANGTSVRAVPDTGYHFTKWSDSSTDNPRTDTDVTRDIDVTALFEINRYTISLYPNPTEGGTVVNAGVYETGRQLTVVAIPNDEYRFISWTENGDEVSSYMDYTFTVTSDRILFAHFEESGLCAAAYILDDNPRLEILRKFRDKTLSASDTGIKIISIYYERSEDIIEMCERNPIIRWTFKSMLESLIPVIEIIQ